MLDLRKAMLEAGYKSYDELAARVSKAWLEIEPDAKVPRGRGLGTMLGKLAKGQQAWWRSNPAALDALAAVLERDPDDLELTSPESSSDSDFVFSEFPQIAPLNLSVESPPILWTTTLDDFYGELINGFLRTGALELRGSPPVGPAFWLEIPPGWGRSLLLHTTRARKRVRTAATRTLAEASRFVEGKDMVVICVGEPDPDHDQELLWKWRKRPGLVVLAPFPLPVAPSRPYIHYTGVYGGASSEEIHSSRILEEWQTSMPVPVEGWRSLLCKWVEGRLPDGTLFQADAFFAWLSRVDPLAIVIASPADLLTFAHEAHQHGERRLDEILVGSTRAHVVGDLVEQVSGTDDSPRATWLRAFGAKALSLLAETRFRDLRVAWQGPLTTDEWVSLVPEDLTPSAQASGATEKIVIALEDAGSRRRKRALLSQLNVAAMQPHRQEVIDYLRSAGFLVAAGAGRFELVPRWLGQTAALKLVRESLASDRVSEWGSWALESGRRKFVDAVLLALGDDEFCGVVRRACAALRQDDVAIISAVEALFVGAAARWERDLPFDAACAAELRDTALACLRVRHADDGGSLIVAPVTRWGFNDQYPDGITWLLAAWTWSLNTPSSTNAAIQEMQWAFPGWCAKEFVPSPALPRALHVPPQALRLRFLDVGLVALRRILDDHGPFDGPYLASLLPALVIEHARRGWSPPGTALDSVWATICAPFGAASPASGLARTEQDPLVANWLIDQFRKLPPGERRQSAASLWRWLVSRSDAVAGKHSPLFPFQPYPREVAIFMAAELEPAVVVESLPTAARTALQRYIAFLPPRCRNAAARWIAESAPEHVDTYLGMYEVLGRDDLVGMLALADAPKTSARVAHLLWSIAPEAAAERARRTYLGEPQDLAWPWFYRVSSPASLPVLLDVVESRTEKVPSWLSLWLHNWLPFAGAAAPRIFTILNALAASRGKSASGASLP